MIDEYELPTPGICSPTFGGPHHDILYVVSATLDIDFDAGAIRGRLQRPAGNLFALRGLHKGFAARKPRV